MRWSRRFWIILPIPIIIRGCILGCCWFRISLVWRCILSLDMWLDLFPRFLQVRCNWKMEMDRRRVLLPLEELEDMTNKLSNNQRIRTRHRTPEEGGDKGGKDQFLCWLVRLGGMNNVPRKYMRFQILRRMEFAFFDWVVCESFLMIGFSNSINTECRVNLIRISEYLNFGTKVQH